MNQRKSLIYITPIDIQQANSSASTLSQQINPVAFELAALVLGIAPFTGPQAKRDLEIMANKQNWEPAKYEQNPSPEIPNSRSLLDSKESGEIDKRLKKHNLSSWDCFIEQIYFLSIPKELKFPPGHPMPGKLYRSHPLKNQVYIPIELFDSLLYAEREAELIRILVDLGATKISIKEVSSGKTEGTVRGEAKIVGAGGASIDINNQDDASRQDSRIIQLRGKSWNLDMNFEKEKYSWLSYEPEWEAIVYARLEGGCLLATVELTSDTSYSVSGQLDLTEGFLKDISSLKAGANFVRSNQTKRLFEVEFADSAS